MAEKIKVIDIVKEVLKEKIEELKEYPEPVGEFEIEDGVLIKGEPDKNGICIIPYGVEKIADHSFEDCNSLTRITIPYSVKYIAKSSFTNCSSLTDITIKRREGILKNENDIEYSIYSILTETKSRYPIIVNDEVVYGQGCNGEVFIPDGVTTIGKNAFLNCKAIKSVSLPESVKRIENGAFDGCTSLEEVVILNKEVEIGDDAFRDCTSLTSINVSISKYKKAFTVTLSEKGKKRESISSMILNLSITGGWFACAEMLLQKWDGNAINSKYIFIFLVSVLFGGIAYYYNQTLVDSELIKKEITICDRLEKYISYLLEFAILILLPPIFMTFFMILVWKILKVSRILFIVFLVFLVVIGSNLDNQP